MKAQNLLSNRFSVKMVLVMLLIAVLQALSIWNFQGDKVDESELVHFAVGFLGGDLDPHWYGYGSLGMYFLFFIYFFLGQFLVGLGVFQSMVDFASSFFASGYFVIIGRLFFAFVGVLTIYLYYLIGRQLRVSKAILVIFVVSSIFSIDSLYFANYIRCDQLVALFYALLVLILLSNYELQSKVILASIVCAAATASKVSALPCIVILNLWILFAPVAFTTRFKFICLSSVIFVFASFVFQPFHHPLFSVYFRLFEEGARFNYSKEIYSGILEHLTAIGSIYYKYLSKIDLVLLLFIPFLLHKYWRFSLLAGSLLALFVAPYFVSSEVTFYWFVPTFHLVRFVGYLSFYSFIETVFQDRAKIIMRVVVGVILVGILVGSWNRYSFFAKSILNTVSNKELAEKWLNQNPQINEILLDAHYDHVMPKVYGNNALGQQKEISNLFIYGRDKNRFLNEIFEDFLDKQSQKVGFTRTVMQARMYNMKASAQEEKARAGKYIIVSPAVYNRFLKNNGSKYPPEKMKELQGFKFYYQRVLKNRLVKSFAEGSGASLEIYFWDDREADTSIE